MTAPRTALVRWAPLALALALGCAGVTDAAPLAQTPPPVASAANRNEVQSVIMPDFTFADGAHQPLRIAFRTLGKPHRDSAGNIDNAVLLLHGTGGSSAAFIGPQADALFYARGAPFDLSRTYVVIPDAIGAGASSRPSDGGGLKFPHYTYADMVRAQLHVVHDTLGIKRLRVILGTSMGGSHAWLWATHYPQMADTVIALSSLPVAPAGRNLLWRVASRDALLADPSPGGAGLKTAALLGAMMTVAPPALKRMVPDMAAAEGLATSQAPAPDAIDLAYQFDAVRGYNPQGEIGDITAKVVVLNFADDPLYPPDTDPMPDIVRQQPRITAITVPESDATIGHMTLARPAVWLPYVAATIRTAMGATN